jgi:hypothetical protein
MKTIQVDMFAVGLGAAVLTQFALEDGSIVTVLADGGSGHDHPVEGVLRRLEEALGSFRSGRSIRIDLIIGTHYDGDHLKGLLPIAQDESIEIGDVWLPPLKNDTEEILHPPEADDFLAGQLFDDRSGVVLLNYLDDKAAQVEELARLEREAVAFVQERSREGPAIREWRLPLPGYLDADWSSVKDMAGLRRELRSDAPIPGRVEAYRAFFEAHEADAARRTDGGRAHESATYDSRYVDALDLARGVRNHWSLRAKGRREMLLDVESYPDRVRIAPAALARIRKSIASGAITASHLAKVVEALRNRKRPVRPRCVFVADGRPSRFAWAPSKGRFVGREEGGDTDLTLTLLGPSEQLVEKHREKLPVGTYLYSVMHQDEPIHLESITPSNQLSYILTLEMSGQRILISGDAGCYGFKDDGREYYEELLKPLTPLHVVQVAHHAGHNYDFYNALLAAGFGNQEVRPFLLVSHAKLDEHRPSPAFREFVARVRRKGEEAALLFTAVPDVSKVEDYDELIHQPVPSGAGAEEGDIRLGYRADSNPVWIVERHSVTVSPR